MFAFLMNNVLPTLIKEGAAVLMAVSGGPDSMAMADVFCRYANRDGQAGRSVRLAAVHINHGLRQEAEKEEDLVRNFALERGLPLVVHRFEAKTYAQSVRKPLQEAAREWRYRCFMSVMGEMGLTSLATAHHMNDQAETLVYRFLRGSGTSGLAGIWPDRLETGWVQEAQGERGLQMRLIRPLLSVSKKDILAYCHEQRIAYALDKSNESGEYIRNRIRKELIPYLEQNYNPRLQEVLSHTAEVMCWDEAFFQNVVAEKWPLYGQGIYGRAAALLWAAWQEPEAILSRLLRRAMALVRQEPRGMEQRFVKGLMEGNFPRGWSRDLPGLRVVAAEEALVLLNPSVSWKQADVDDGFFRILSNGLCDNDGETEKHIDVVLVPNMWKELKGPGKDRFNKGKVQKIGLFSADMAEGLKKETNLRIMANIVLDQETAAGRRGAFEYRGRRPGDRVYVAGVGHKRLKKIWQEHNVPSYQRDGFRVLAVGSLVLAIPGLEIVSGPEVEKGTEDRGLTRWFLLGQVCQ